MDTDSFHNDTVYVDPADIGPETASLINSIFSKIEAAKMERISREEPLEIGVSLCDLVENIIQEA